MSSAEGSRGALSGNGVFHHESSLNARIDSSGSRSGNDASDSTSSGSEYATPAAMRATVPSTASSTTYMSLFAVIPPHPRIGLDIVERFPGSPSTW